MGDVAGFSSLETAIERCSPGEWGDDPTGDNSNCVVYRATDIDSDGNLRLDGGADRVVSSPKVALKALQPGDIVLEASGGAPGKPVGRVALFDGPSRKPALVSNFFRSMRPRAHVDSRFLTHQLVALNRSSAIWRYQQQTTGLINLKVSDYLKHLIWMPPLRSQRKIGAILTCLDTAIEKTEALIEKHEQIKAGLMHDLFTRGVLPNGQLRPAKAQAPELYVLTHAGWLPREWGLKKLGELVNPARPIVYGILMPGYGHPGGVPVVKVKDIRGRQIDDSSLLLTSPSIDREYRRSKLKSGDVLFTIRGSVGRLAIVPKHLEGANITQDTARIDLVGASNLFVSLYLETAPAQRFFQINTLGVAVQGINLGELRKTPIPLPPDAEQTRIAEALSMPANTLSAYSAHLRGLRQQKLGLMQDLLTGKVPVNTAEAATSA